MCDVVKLVHVSWRYGCKEELRFFSVMMERSMAACLAAFQAGAVLQGRMREESLLGPEGTEDGN